MTVATVRTDIPEGLFGPLPQTPLISDLVHTALIDALIRGFGAKHPSVFTGIVQNDGTVFPSAPEEKATLFCSFCRCIRDTEFGRKACEASDTYGISQLLGSSALVTAPRDHLADSEYSVVTYDCHAGNTELLSPILLYFDDHMPPVTVGGFWAGQIRNRSFTDDDTVLTELASNIGQNAGHLRELHEVGRAVLNPQDLDGVRNSLREWAKALSQTITDAYRLQQTELSNDIQSQFRHCLSSGMERAQRRSKGGPSESVLARFVKPALRALQDSYHLEDVAIWRVDEKRLTLTQWCSSDGHDPAVIPISREIAIQATPGAPYVAASDSAPDSLTTFLLSELGKCDAAERTCIHVTETNRRGKYLILFQELAGSTWQIQGRAVQPAVAALLEGIGEAIATECDTLDRLEEEMTRNAALSERQEQTRKLCIRMAHLVSRPLLELKFAVKAFVSNPNLARLHMDACLTELARAVGVFQTFEFLTGDEKKGSKNGSSTSVIECLTSARETLLPLARLQRRTIEFYSHRRTEDCRVAVDTEPLLEIFENLLHNALKYSFGGRPVEVHVRLADPTNVEIQIINYGCGIGLNEFDKVFELEYRSPMGKRFVVEGSGIGLWVVRELTSLYEGEVRIVQSIEHDTYVVRKREVILYRTVLELRLPLAAT